MPTTKTISKKTPIKLKKNVASKKALPLNGPKIAANLVPLYNLLDLDKEPHTGLASQLNNTDHYSAVIAAYYINYSGETSPDRKNRVTIYLYSTKGFISGYLHFIEANTLSELPRTSLNSNSKVPESVSIYYKLSELACIVDMLHSAFTSKRTVRVDVSINKTDKSYSASVTF